MTMRNVVHCLQFVRLTCAAVCFGVSTMTVLACRTNSSHSETTGSFDAIPRVQETENAAAIIQRGFRAAALKSGRSQSQARVGTNDGVIHKNKKKAPPSGPPILGPLDPDLEDLGLSSREVQSTMAAMTSHRGSVDYEEEQDMTSVDIIMLDEDDLTHSRLRLRNTVLVTTSMTVPTKSDKPETTMTIPRKQGTKRRGKTRRTPRIGLESLPRLQPSVPGWAPPVWPCLPL